MKLLLPVILVSTLLIWKFYVNQNVFINNFYPIVYILTFMWGRNMMLMQVCYVTKQRFHSFNLGRFSFYERHFDIFGYLGLFNWTLLDRSFIQNNSLFLHFRSWTSIIRPFGIHCFFPKTSKASFGHSDFLDSLSTKDRS